MRVICSLTPIHILRHESCLPLSRTPKQMHIRGGSHSQTRALIHTYTHTDRHIPTSAHCETRRHTHREKPLWQLMKSRPEASRQTDPLFGGTHMDSPVNRVRESHRATHRARDGGSTRLISLTHTLSLSSSSFCQILFDPLAEKPSRRLGKGSEARDFRQQKRTRDSGSLVARRFLRSPMHVAGMKWPPDSRLRVNLVSS